jgi:hypothetical protein
MKYTQTTLDKIDRMIEESGYIVRYERGSFQSGFCILEDRKVVVLNKFLQLEGRINTLIDLVPQLKIVVDALTPESKKWYNDIMGRFYANNPATGNPTEENAAEGNAADGNTGEDEQADDTRSAEDEQAS